MRALHWRGHGYLGSRSASTSLLDTNGDTVENDVPGVTGSSVSGLIEDDDDWNLGGILLSRNTDVLASLRVDFRAIQTQCLKLSLAALDKAGDLFGLALRGLDALHKPKEARTRVAALNVSGDRAISDD